MAITIKRSRARAVKRAIEQALRAGHAPPGARVAKGARGAIAAAAQAMGEPAMTLRYLASDGGPLARMGLAVDWSVHAAPPAAPTPAPAAAPPAEARDPVEIRRARDASAAAQAAQARAERATLTAAGARAGLLRLAAEPMAPPSWPVDRAAGGKHREVLLAMLSDVHMGEVISKEMMGGRNSYDKRIAGARLARYFRKIVELGTTHWSGPPPACIYLALAGDMISGEIHDELARTNDLLSIPAVQELVGHLVAGVDLLLSKFACEIRIVSTPGNHGRVTRKPEAKGFAVDSYDTLVAWALELVFKTRAEKGDASARRVSVSAPKSGDALIELNGWRVLITHGDRIGLRGGMGFVGPAATIARGMQKIIMDYAADGQVVDYCLVGHFHTALALEQGFANGCLPGPSEYSKSGRMRPAPATQWLLAFHPYHGVSRRWLIEVGEWLLAFHPYHGVSRRWLIEVGDPSEGSIYKGRAR